jgi:sterol desaturase/sphingolipid hydroxylase (fatty acid hydroxylase superfamily)
VGPAAVLAALAGGAAAAGLGALLASYILEEWTHHYLHYGRGGGPIFRTLRRRHMRHHSPGERDRIFGLTSGLWDVALGTAARPRP